MILQITNIWYLIGGIALFGIVIMYLIVRLRNLYQTSASEKTHMTSLFENATEGIILTSANGNIVLVNPAAERIFGYLADELIGKPIEILIPSQYRHGHDKLREGFLKHPTNRVMGHGRDLKGQKKNGDNFPVEVSLSYYKRNNAPYVIAFIVDITQRKQIEEDIIRQQKELENVTKELKKLNAELEAKVEERTVILREALIKLEQSQKELSESLDKERELNEIKSRFVSMASHEFRTPLSTILSSATLISKYPSSDEQEKRDKHINRIKESVKNLNDILEDFLSLGKLNEGKVNVQIAECDLHTLIQDTTEEMKPLLKKNQKINYEHTGASTIHSDKKLLKNILINLISNAIKFSREDGSVHIKSWINNGTANFAVADNGIGIPDEDKEHLFSSFFRGKNVTNIQGTGLGLHIVKRYIDLLNGEIKLQSRLEHGTTISFSIPITDQI